MNTDFLKDHSLHYIEMALKTDRIEKVDSPDAYGKRTGECGDTVEFFLTCRKNMITSISFYVQGCMNTVACCNTVAHFAEGKHIDSAWDITTEQVIDFLETLPETHHHCAQLSVGALYLALSNVNSWRNLYKKV